MEAAFVDIGTPKNGVLYRGDVAFDEAEVEGGSKPKIERLLKNGQIGHRAGHEEPDRRQGRPPHPGGEPGRPLRRDGAEPARHLRHLEAAARRRAQAAAQGSSTGSGPTDAGLIVRTAAEGATRRRARARRAPARATSGSRSRRWRHAAKPAQLLYQEPDLVLRRHPRGVHQGVPRRSSSTTRRSTRRSAATSRPITPELADRVEYYDAEEEGLPIFERFHVHEQLLKALDRKVWLPSGGSLIIERTEALTVIDVNTGKNVGQVQPRGDRLPQQPRGGRGGRPPAAAARHRRDHRHRLHRHGDQEEPRRGHAGRSGMPWPGTRPAPRSFDISELGLVEMTRKRISEGLVESFSEHLPDLPRAGASSSTRRCCEDAALEFTDVRHAPRSGPVHVRSDPHRRQAVPGRARCSGSRSSVSVPTTAARSTSRRSSSSTATRVLATPGQLGGAVVTARVVGDAKGPKIDGFIYKTKTQQPPALGPPPALLGDRDHRRSSPAGA